MPSRSNTIEILLKATDDASKDIGNVEGALNKLGVAAAATVKIAAGAAIAIGGALLEMAREAAPLEGIKKAFVGLTDSMGLGADKMLAALQKGSQGMITNRDLMMNFNLAAQLVNRQFAEQLPDAMQYLTKVSAATGQSMDYLLNSLILGVGRLSPRILDNLAIQISLTDAYEEYAKSIGKSADALTREEQQIAVMNATMTKLKENTGAFPDIADNASTKLQQFGANVSNLRDNIGIAFLPVLKLLMDGLNSLVTTVGPAVVEVVGDVANAIAGIFSYFQNAVAGGANPISAFLNALANAFGQTVPLFTQLRDLWDNTLQPIFTDIPGTLDKASQAAQDLGNIGLLALTGGLDTASTSAQNLMDLGLLKLVETLQDVSNRSKDLIGSVDFSRITASLVVLGGTLLTMKIGAAFQAILAGAQGLPAMFAALIGSIKAVAAGLWAMITPVGLVIGTILLLTGAYALNLGGFGDWVDGIGEEIRKLPGFIQVGIVAITGLLVASLFLIGPLGTAKIIISGIGTLAAAAAPGLFTMAAPLLAVAAAALAAYFALKQMQTFLQNLKDNAAAGADAATALRPELEAGTVSTSQVRDKLWVQLQKELGDFQARLQLEGAVQKVVGTDASGNTIEYPLKLQVKISNDPADIFKNIDAAVRVVTEDANAMQPVSVTVPVTPIVTVEQNSVVSQLAVQVADAAKSKNYFAQTIADIHLTGDVPAIAGQIDTHITEAATSQVYPASPTADFTIGADVPDMTGQVGTHVSNAAAAQTFQATAVADITVNAGNIDVAGIVKAIADAVSNLVTSAKTTIQNALDTVHAAATGASSDATSTADTAKPSTGKGSSGGKPAVATKDLGGNVFPGDRVMIGTGAQPEEFVADRAGKMYPNAGKSGGDVHIHFDGMPRNDKEANDVGYSVVNALRLRGVPVGG